MEDEKAAIYDGMSDREFFNFCQLNPDLRLERDPNKRIQIKELLGFYTGVFSSGIFGELFIWNRKTKMGKVFNSSLGFTLPDGAVFAANATWVSNKKISSLKKKDKNRFAPICPDFVIELKSPSDRLNGLKNKMLKWIENGAQLAWLIDPKNKQVFIYRADGSIAIIKGFTNKLSGEDILPGFELDLKMLQ